MSDDQPSLLLHAESSDAAVAAQAALPSPTAGQMLKQARLRSGLSLEGLGARVKVTVARLQALEDDQFDAWPNINVLRAAAASVCRHVQLDPVVILDRLPKAEKIQLTVAGPAAQVGFRDRAGFTLRRSGGGERLPLVLTVTALLLLAAFFYLAPALMPWVDHLAARDVPAAAPSVTGAVSDPVLPPDAGPTDTRVGAVVSEPVLAAPIASAPMAATPSSSASPTNGTPQDPLVVIKAKGFTWIAVSDAKGVTLLRKTLSAGETASASGTLPLWVVVGRADNAEVLVRGEAVKLEPTAQDNVARFKVQ